MSIFATSQCRAISSAASRGMMPSRPCTTASARSNSRYLAVRFSSDQMRRMASVEKMLPKMRESMRVAPMGGGLRGKGKGKGAARLALRAVEDVAGPEDHRAIDHAPVDLHGAGTLGHRGFDATRPG